jgi:hypothetical protein
VIVARLAPSRGDGLLRTLVGNVPIAAPHEVKAPETGPAEPPRLPQFLGNRIITLFGKIAK